jgi:hypothetical protein
MGEREQPPSGHEERDPELDPVILCQPISAAIGKAIGIKFWIPFLMTAWGLFTLMRNGIQNLIPMAFPIAAEMGWQRMTGVSWVGRVHLISLVHPL